MPYHPPEADPAPAEEVALRQRLGIPSDAERVLIFAESTHWDPDWLLTAEGYFRRFVARNMDLTLAVLEQNPRRVYSLGCLFFLRMYWDRYPARRDQVRALLNEGRLRLTSSGVTTADTLLPSTEAILRDWLVGQEWLRTNEIEQEPRLAYFVDSFGASPALPSLLLAAGFDRTAITRIEGMAFPGPSYERASRFPKPGSSAEYLMEHAHTLDFIWRDAAGAEVLCHWNAFTYGQGDMLAFRGLSRMYLMPIAVPDRSERHVARQIGRFAAQLEPYRPTPYMFCPIGSDFVPPIPRLVELLDRYNRVRYPSTGVWTVNAGLDDYLDLIACYTERLPTVELDPNPYWMGFYTARPGLKRRCHQLVDTLVLAEKLALRCEDRLAGANAVQELQVPWWTAVTANHHDYITGTSPDEIVEEEQLPWLEYAQESADAAVAECAPNPALEAYEPARPVKPAPAFEHQEGRIVIRTPHLVLELDPAAGGTIARASDPASGRVLLGSGSNDLVLYLGSGGTYRMGHEYSGGYFRQVSRASATPVQVEVAEHEDGLLVSCTTELGSERYRRALWVTRSPVLHLLAEGRAPDRHTVTVCFIPGIETQALTMDAAGGVVQRPLQRIYKPTFWPMRHFLHLVDGSDGHGLALWQALPGAISYQVGQLHTVANRNATRERVYGLLPIPANPVTAHEREAYRFEYALLLTEGGDWQQNQIPQIFERGVPPWRAGRDVDLQRWADTAVAIDREDVQVTAAKPASRGEGIIVRLYAPAPPVGQLRVSLPDRAVRQAFRCDARERDLEPLSIVAGTVQLAMPGTFATVRVLT
jgi:hypothetical protein